MIIMENKDGGTKGAGTFEVVRKKFVHNPDSSAAQDVIFILENGRQLTAEEFSKYHEEHETDGHHIVIM